MFTSTTVSSTDGPVTTVTENTSHPSHLRHALIVDPSPPATSDSNSNRPSFLDQLRSLATQPFDMLQFCDDTPSLAVWQALRDLEHISHLEMISGFDECCNIAPLDQVGSSWPLQSLVIGSACGEDMNTTHILTITSLTLDHCCGLSFSLATRNNSSQLKRLIIIENDACDHFIKMKDETCLINNLLELKIVSTNGCDFAHQYGTECFGKALIECHSLKSLDLILDDVSEDAPKENYLTELPAFFPVNVEVLRFRGPPSLANHLAVWHKCIADPQWLPNLKSIEFCLDVCFPNTGAPLESAKLAHKQCRQLLASLASLRPSVTILNEDQLDHS